MIAELRIDEVVLQHHIDRLGAIGVDEEGALFRPVYSQPWLEARALLEQWMRDAGLTSRVDAVGNLFGRLDGTDPSRPVVLSGSHIDTVRNGGKYDGALGVHAALAAVSAIVERGVPPTSPIEVVALCEEEGSRYTSPLWGTQAILGVTAAGAVDQLIDIEGVTIADAMRGVGLDPARLGDARRSDIGTFVELHIEQGAILENEAIALGVVEVITGQRHFVVTVNGMQNHAGTTPMNLRTDALTGAAEMVVAIERIARERGRPTVATVGRLELTPGSRNVIPGMTEFTIDIRNPDGPTLDAFVEGVREAIIGIAAARGLRVDIVEEVASASQPVPMNPAIRTAISDASTRLGVSWRPMVSGAGHDSQLFARHIPTGMIFTPSARGISHSPEEFTPLEQIVPCVLVLAETLWALAGSSAQAAAAQP